MKFTISILCHSALPLARQCIDSVRRNSVGSDYELILTANGNPDAARYFNTVSDLLHPVRVVVNETNEGFIEPNRRALSVAKGEFFVMLNDDAVVPPGWLERLEQPFKDDKKCAVSGPVGCILLKDFVGHPCFGYFDYIEGSCLCVRADLARQHGLFDPALFFAYCEDADLCLRMKEAGHTIHRADFLLHHVSGTTAKTIPGLRERVAGNFEYCRKRWANYIAK